MHNEIGLSLYAGTSVVIISQPASTSGFESFMMGHSVKVCTHFDYAVLGRMRLFFICFQILHMYNHVICSSLQTPADSVGGFIPIETCGRS